jgi:hypothetical protein
MGFLMDLAMAHQGNDENEGIVVRGCLTEGFRFLNGVC